MAIAEFGELSSSLSLTSAFVSRLRVMWCWTATVPGDYTGPLDGLSSGVPGLIMLIHE